MILNLYATDLDHLMIDLISLCFTVPNFKLIITIIESKLSGYFVDFIPNPLAHQTSPYIITPESHIKVNKQILLVSSSRNV